LPGTIVEVQEILNPPRWKACMYDSLPPEYHLLVSFTAVVVAAPSNAAMSGGSVTVETNFVST
jgi:hypothetical protein